MVTEYDREFQEFLIEHASKSAEKIMPFVIELFHPKSIVDFGCGTASFLAVAKKNLGGGYVLGLDGDYIERDLLMVDYENEFKAVDLTQKIVLPQKFDMAMSLEVAEHLDEKYSDQFIENITNASDVILFSAAIPGQYGVHHVNEQCVSYWIEKFANKGFQPFDIIRPHFWWDEEVELDYRQNSVIFVKENCYKGIDLASLEMKIWDIAHPKSLEGRTKAWRYWMDKVDNIQEKHKFLSKILKTIWKVYKN